ncbi:amino acid adenylation domain-containing protein [Micromonospora craniellae]|uniref:Amino acid adenylation domain-containing protein n=1 Tax=Micromonospora craniellae TaxID=2294034 RepID=A0A372G3Q7_9ACTN|nr:amino acid adenylation domain-containing protein [Micromonospora craniellae]RFS47588.1 amino acid adenylation domain-containing protein [Micromonospora craniellae]
MLDILVHAANRTPDQVVVHVRDDGAERTVTFRQLRDDSLRIAGGYRAAGVVPGTPVLLLADAGDDFQPLFWGALAAGLVPVPLPPEPARVRAVRALLTDAVTVVDDTTEAVADGLAGPVLRLADLRTGTPPEELFAAAPTDVAFLQFSSGSTGAPRGVELTHANVLANVEQARLASGAGPDDVLVTWMPFFHDMGLIGTHLTPLAIGCKQVRVPPLAFAKRPALWFTTAHRHRATLLSAANFALALAVRRVPADLLATLDLSRVRCVVVGAEPISPTVWRAFLAHVRPAALAPSALRPVYGLAEATLAVTFPPPGEVAAPLVLDRAALSQGRAVPTGPGTHAVELMDLGYPVPGCEVRIVDERHRPLPEDRVGLIEVRGPNVARGYHRDSQASRETFVDGWLRTGDLGFRHAGRLCVTGRAKDVIFVNGRTFHAPDLEAVAAATVGLPATVTAVVGCTDPDTGGERIVVFVAWARPPVGAAVVLDATRARVAEAAGHDDVRVLPLPPGTFARTTSGKLRRRRMRERYLAGDFTDRERRWHPPAHGGAHPAALGVAHPSAAGAACPVAGPPSDGSGPLSRRRVEQIVRAVWARVLDRPADTITADDRFLAIGGSSLKAMEVLAGLEDALGATFDPADLRDCPTVAALTDRILAGPPATRPAPPGGRAPASQDARPGTAPLAVIGMACRFPGADDPDEFWRCLVDGVDAVRPVPSHRWTPQDGRPRWGSFLDDPMRLDADFFGLTDEEARLADPHARLFLEIGYEALDRAGYAGPRRQGRRIGVFAAVGESAYPELLAAAGPVTAPAALVGNLRNLVAARLSQTLDLVGPAIAVDTACSSALVALHLAARSLATGECDIALVGGVTLHLTETAYRLLDAAEALSPTGRCRAFDADADGFVPGEGGAALVLCRTDDAYAAGDRVLALVAGTAVGNDGRSLSMLAPNPQRQWEVIARAYADARLDPAAVSYVEAHGTGTGLGDPVEVRSLAAAFPRRPDGMPRWLGSVKTNLGHLLNTAGMPALLKVMLALRHRQLPPSLHHVRPSTRYDLDAAGFAVVTEARPWTAPGPLVAGVNAFGFGGTNAHAVLCEAPPREPAPPPAGTGVHLVTLTARSAYALRRSAHDLAGHLRARPDLDVADVVASAGTSRDDAPYRLALVADGTGLADRLAAAASAYRDEPVRRRPRTVFVFPGDGPPLPAPAVRDLHDRLPVFRALLTRACAAAGPVAGRPLLSWCLGDGEADQPDGRVTGPAGVVVALALAGQLAAWGVRPDALLGHGVGELAAAAASGALGVAEAVRRTVALADPAEDRHADDGYAALAALRGVPVFSPAAGRWDPPDPVRWVTGTATGPELRAAWRRLHDDGYDTVVELGVADPTRDSVDLLTDAGTGLTRVVAVRCGSDTGTASLLATAGLLWARGSPLDRPALYAGRRRVPVPTYPFARRAYPPPGPAHAVPVHAVAWREVPTVAGVPARRVRLCGPGVGGPFADALAVALTADGIEVRTDPARADTPTDLAPDASGPPPETTVLLAGAAVDTPDVAALDVAVAEQVRAVRALIDEGVDRPGRLLVVTEDVHVTGAAAERGRPVQAVLAGLAAALADERPGLLVHAVDLSSSDGTAARVDAVRREMCAFAGDPAPADGHASPGPLVGAGVAWRGGRRLARFLDPVPTAADRTDEPAGGGPVAGAVHLIVGGAGGVGAALARSLARRDGPTLLLAGRSDRAPAALLAELTARGATATYHRCDVTVPADVDALLAAVPRVDTVFHAAGTVRVGTLRAKSVQDVLAVLGPKVRGSHLLAEALRRHGHDRTVLVGFSSVSAVLPGLAGAIGDYAAANRFLDAFAAAHRAAGRPVQAVGFAAISDTGMAARTGRTGTGAMRVDDALRGLAVARHVDAAHLVVADPVAVPRVAAPPPAVPVDATVGAADAAVGAADGGPAGVDGGPGRGEVARLLRRLLAEPLHRRPDEIADDTSFLALGLDSLAAVDLVKRLEEELGRDLPVTLFFEYTTVADLAAHLTGARGVEPVPPTARAPLDESRTLVEGEPFPLTAVQRAFHVNERLHPTVASFAFVQQTVTGPLDAGLLGQALARLEARHPMLRVRFTPGPGTPRQVVPPVPVHPAPTTPDWYAVRSLTEPLAEAGERLCNTPVDLTRQPPLRVVLVREGADRAHLMLVLHHAAGDGFSLNLLSEELWADYTALAHGRAPVVRPPAPGFDAYAREVTVPAPEDLAYWRGLLAGGAALRLPFDGDPDTPPGPPVLTHQGELAPELVAVLRERAAQAGVSLFHLLLAGYMRCLARWGGQRRVPVTVARAGRDARLAGIDRIVGPFADTLPVVIDVDPDEPVGQLADRLRVTWSAAQRHGSVTSLDLARLLDRPGAGPRTASPAGFSFARFPVTRDPDCPVDVTPTAAGSGSAATRLSLLCWESGDGLGLSWNFPRRLFTRATVARLAAEHRDDLVTIATGRPPLSTVERAATALDATPAGQRSAEADRAVAHRSDAGPAGQRSAHADQVERQPVDGGDVTARIRAVCRRTPDAVAVTTGERTMTYRTLDRDADRVAALLARHGVRPGDRVGLLTAPGPQTVVGVVGILRAGAAWVPLDTAHPPTRLADHLVRAGAGLLLHDDESAAIAARLDAAARPVLFGPGTDDAVEEHDVPSVPDAAPDRTAYVIFTSGSTGRPKGVPVSHRSMRTYLDWAVATFDYRPGDRLAQTASSCFDASVRQILAPLLVGATVVTFTRAQLRDPQVLLSRIAADRITVWSSVPTLWERILRSAEEHVRRHGEAPDLTALRWVHVGGEELSPVAVRRWFDLYGDARITNLYGPTEATINATWHLIDKRPDDTVRRLPIGRPVGGAVVRVVDPAGRVCPPGAAGELYLGGAGLTTGYLGEPELTGAAFVVHDGERFYRSGDRGRLAPDGTLEFLGRLDDQVKIHGHRVEPGEIEAVLRTHPEVASATVLHHADPYPRLHAFVLPAPQATPTTAALRAHLAAHLPAHMVPARIHLLDSLPLTATGKVDRESLAALVTSATDSRAPAPADADVAAPARATAGAPAGTEAELARIWAGLLAVPAVGPHDDFFALGGDSILALELFAHLQQNSAVTASPTLIYEHRTPAALAAVLDAEATTGDDLPTDAPADATAGPVTVDRSVADAVPQAGSAAPFPVTAAQRGFLLADAVAPGAGTAWLARLRLHGPLRRDAFQRAVDVLVARHPMLRTVFPAGARPPVQQELPAAMRLPVAYESVTDLAGLGARVAEERRRRFEPWAWPLLRLRLLRLAPDEHVLLVHAHHLIGDGYSAALLGHELLAAYHADGTADPLPPLRAGFRDYVRLLAEHTAGAPDPAAYAWWSQRFGSAYRPPVLRADTDRPDADGTTDRSTLVRSFTLDATVVAGLRRLAVDASTTLYAPVLTAYHRVLARLTGQHDLVLGLAVTGRDHPLPDLHRIFGPCAAMLPLRLAGTDAFPVHLARVAAEVTAARQHADPPSIAAAVPARRPDGAPAGAQFFFSFLDFDALRPATPATLGTAGSDRLDLSWDEDTELAPPPLGTDLFLTARPVADGLRVTLRGSPTAVTATDLEQLADRLRTDLSIAATEPGRGTTEPNADATEMSPASTESSPGATGSSAAGTDRPRAGSRAGATPDTGPSTGLTAAIVGYLPSPAQLAVIAGLPAGSLPRDQLRELLFPGARPRLLEELATPLGTSGFVCLPRFADELTTAGDRLATEAAAAVDLAAGLGAACVSLAGLIPALTGYGVGVLRRTRTATAVTTGHAATVVSVVLTVEAALAAAGRSLAGRTVAVAGLGSIGFSSLRLLLARAPRPPARLLLCDLPAVAPRLADQVARLRADGLTAAVEICPTTPAVPDLAYAADLIIGATSAATEPLDVDRLRPGTIVVDDSFPHALDPARALARMRRDLDVLVVGGGLLQVGRTSRSVPVDLPSAAIAGHAAALGLPGTIASCQLESLLRAGTPTLPLVHGLVDDPTAAAYAVALDAAGITAGPLHLLRHLVEPDLPAGLPEVPAT